MGERSRRMGERAQAMQKLIDECQDLMSPVTFQLEPWDAFARDGQVLFAEHKEEVGDYQELGFSPNFERAALLDRAGKLQVATARAGKQLVGYIVFVIDEHPEDVNTLHGIQNTFFVARQFRGVGLKLRAFAISKLKKRGVEILSLSAGVRGSGPKLAALYQREGAIEERRVFSLRI
jgi:hypothetical protein